MLTPDQRGNLEVACCNLPIRLLKAFLHTPVYAPDHPKEENREARQMIVEAIRRRERERDTVSDSFT